MSYNKKISPTVSSELEVTINVVLIWSLNSWFLFTSLFFTLKSPYLAQNMFFLINFIIILWFIWELGPVLFDIHKGVVSGKKVWFLAIFCFFWGGNWAQIWTKTINFGYVSFLLKHLILKDCSETVFFLWKTYLWLKFQQTRVIFAGERAQKPPKRGYFMDAASPRKHLKIYNLTTTNAALMKLTMVMYLHKTFNVAEDWCVTHGA